jgi:large subunit ribosomal protein L6
MSRLGKRPIEIPAKVKLTHAGGLVTVEGPKGKVTTPILEGITLKVEGSTAHLTRASEEAAIKAKHGLCRMLLANAINGVVNEYRKELEVFGVGYKCAIEGKNVVLNLGYSHAIKFPIPPGIKIEIDKLTKLVVSGADKQQVGQVAADLYHLKKPDPYKNKGVRFVGQKLRTKVGKTGTK